MLEYIPCMHAHVTALPPICSWMKIFITYTSIRIFDGYDCKLHQYMPCSDIAVIVFWKTYHLPDCAYHGFKFSYLL